jgi:glycine/D-amino acid oxidase-like deaminating enzyme
VLETDVVVAGGGMAGVCAAVASARNGAKVVLVQNRSRLGGNSSSEVRMHIMGANWFNNRPGWREGGLLEEFRLDDAVNNPQRCRELWDLLLYDKVVHEPGITLLLDTAVVAADVADGRITGVTARCDTSGTNYHIAGKIFCDCTGDAHLAFEAGAEIRFGREARAEFGESLAPDRSGPETLGSSILFTSRKHDRPMPFTPPSWARKLDASQLRGRTIHSWEYGYWWVEWGGHLDTIRDNERIRFETLAIALGVWDHIKNSGCHPASRDWALDWIGMVPGKRESRRVVGDHILTQNDLVTGGDFADTVAIGGWPMDEHPPGGFDQKGDSPGRQVVTADIYGIPLRCLHSRNIANLMMAGRNISATHVAFSSTRVMGTCSALGQACGTAAALCVRHGVTPRELGGNKTLLSELQQTLLRQDQTLKGVPCHPPGDLAPLARITASGESAGAPAANIVNGWTRDFPGASLKVQPELDVPLEVIGSGVHAEKAVKHWAAGMGPDGAWIEFRWDPPQVIRRVEIVFDSGFHRPLILTSSDSINEGVIRAPQPETVRDYDVLVRRAGEAGFAAVARVAGNHQRLRAHDFAPVGTEALRVHVRATNGDPLARIFQIRCFA